MDTDDLLGFSRMYSGSVGDGWCVHQSDSPRKKQRTQSGVPAGNTDPIAERCTPLAAGQIFTEGNEDNEGVFRLSYPRLLLLQFGLLGDFRQQPNGSFRQAEAKPEPQRADEP